MFVKATNCGNAALLALEELMARPTMRIYENRLLVEQWRLPRTKKRRIRRKWAKIPANWRPSPTVLAVGNCLVMHPRVAQALRSHVDRISRHESITTWLDDVCSHCPDCGWSDFPDNAPNNECPDCGARVTTPAPDESEATQPTTP
jgi:hypothetical protein